MKYELSLYYISEDLLQKMSIVLIVNRVNCGTAKEDSAGACISDVKNCLISKIAAESLSDMKFQDSVETEQQHKNLQSRLTELDVGEEATHATQGKSWTGWLKTRFH